MLKEAELGISNQEVSTSAGKNTGVVLVPCSHMEVCPYCYFWWCGYFWGLILGVICYDRWVLSERQKNYFKYWCLLNVQPTVLFLMLTRWIMAILSEGCKPENFELHNSLKLSFTNILGLRSNFVDCECWLWIFPWIKFSWHVRQTWMTQLILANSLWGVIFL